MVILPIVVQKIIYKPNMHGFLHIDEIHIILIFLSSILLLYFFNIFTSKLSIYLLIKIFF
jgi:hypothetical protein